MKRVVFLTVIVLLSYVAAKSQCSVYAYQEQGFIPADSTLPCVVRTQPYNQILQFQFDTISSLEPWNLAPFLASIDSLIWDSIVGLPNGLTITFNKGQFPIGYSNHEFGCLQITGTTSVPPGLYKAAFYGVIKVFYGGALTLPVTTDTLDLFTYRFQVIDLGDTCAFGTQVPSTLSIQTNGDQIICIGNSAQLTAQGIGGTGGYAYSWSPANGLSCTNCRNPVLTYSGVQEYIVEVTDGQSTVYDTIAVSQGGCGTIKGNVFEDLNGNGQRDNGENGLSGIKVTLSGSTTTHVVTDFWGNYSTDALFGENYILTASPYDRLLCNGTIVLPDSMTQPGQGSYAVQLGSGSIVVTGKNFGFLAPNSPCGTISGKVFSDVNGNGIRDIGDDGIPGMKVELDNGSFAYSDLLGNYQVNAFLNDPVIVSLNTNSGYYNTNCSGGLLPIQTYPVQPSTYTETLTSGNPNVSGIDFGIFDTVSFDASVSSLVPFASNPGMNFETWLGWEAFGPSTNDCYLRLTYNNYYLNFINSTPSPTTVSNGYLEWVLPADSAGVYAFGLIDLEFNLLGSTPQGTPLTFTGSWSCPGGDACAANDSFSYTTTTLGPLKRGALPDFNSMDVIHTGDPTNGHIDNTDSLFSYIIGIQNNTPDSVYSITILDTLSEFLDVNTIQRPFSNFPYTLCVTPDNVLIIQMNNVAVPSSGFDFQNSYGFLQYHIRRKMNIPNGSVISNSATIIFNNSEGVTTNKVENQYLLASVEEQKIDNFELYPNPTTGKLTLNLKQLFVDGHVEIFSLLGERMLSQSLVAGQTEYELDLSDLNNGMYLVRITGQGQSLTKKVMISQ